MGSKVEVKTDRSGRQTYKITDANGRVTYSDKAPSSYDYRDAEAAKRMREDQDNIKIRYDNEPSPRDYQSDNGYASQEQINQYEADKVKHAQEQQEKREREYRERLKREEQKKQEALEKAKKDEFTKAGQCDTNAGKSCAICEGKNLQCVCEIIITDTKNNNQEYYWKSIARGRKAIPKMIFALKEASIKYQIVGACSYSHKAKHCTDLYSYQKKSGANKNNDKTGSVVSWKTGETGNINGLKFNNLVLLDNSGYFIDGVNNPSLKVKSFVATPTLLIERAISFLIMSEFSGIPITPYTIGVTECSKEAGMNTQTFGLLDQHTLKGSKFDVVILPDYSVIAKLELGLDSQSYKTNPTTGRYEKKDGFKLIFKGSIKEKVGTGTENELKIDLAKLSELGKGSIFGVLAKLSDWLGTFKLPLGGSIGPFTLDIIPPKIELNGTGKLAYKNGSALFIERTGVVLKCDPIIGFKVNLDIIHLLLMKVPPIAKLYARYKSSTQRITRFANGKLMTNREMADQLESKKKVSLSLIIYADLSFTMTLMAGGNITSSNVAEAPKSGLNEVGGKATAEFVAGAAAEAQVWVFKGSLKAEFKADTGFEVKMRRNTSNEWKGAIWHNGVNIYATLSAKVGIDVGGVNRSRSESGKARVYEAEDNKPNLNGERYSLVEPASEANPTARF